MVEMSALLFHHACDLANVHHGVLRGERRARRRGVLFEPGSRGDPGHLDLDVRIDLTFDAAYAWAAERVGFWPLFVAVTAIIVAGNDGCHKTLSEYLSRCGGAVIL
jgi:hypothetical protein